MREALKNLETFEEVVEFAKNLKDENIDKKELFETLRIVVKNKELLDLFDRYDRGELKDEDLTFIPPEPDIDR